MDISFDPAKRAETISRRGLDFADAGEVFAGRTVTIQDDRFDYTEDRFITAGHLGTRCVVLIWTPRDGSRRIISIGMPMLVRKLPGSPEADLDDAPELTADMLDGAEVFDGDQFVRRGRGRPPLDAPKEKINVRLDAAVLERLRASGPGWQTRVNDGMAMLTGVDRQLWNSLELLSETNEREIEPLRETIAQMEAGSLRSSSNDQDDTDLRLEQSKASVERFLTALKILETVKSDILDRYLVRGTPAP